MAVVQEEESIAVMMRELFGERVHVDCRNTYTIRGWRVSSWVNGFHVDDLLIKGNQDEGGLSKTYPGSSPCETRERRHPTEELLQV